MILITHTDLDGVGCAVLLKKCLPLSQVVFTSYDEVDDIFLSSLHHDKIWLTDISIKPETLTRAYELCPDLDKRMNLVDHHQTALWLDKYDWALVDTSRCGTHLLYSVLSRDYHLEDMKLFSELVDDHDRWLHRMVGSGEMSRLLYVMGLQPYYERLLNDSTCKLGEGLVMTEGEKLLLKCDHSNMLKYAAGVKERACLLNLHGYTCVTAFASRYISEVASMILEDDTNVEAVFLVNLEQGNVSLRSKGNLDCAEYAKGCGGGGHPKAAGFRIDAPDVLSQLWGITGA